MFNYAQNLSLEQTEELHDDIQKYLTLEQSDLNIDFWTVGLFPLILFNIFIPFAVEYDGRLQR